MKYRNLYIILAVLVVLVIVSVTFALNSEKYNPTDPSQSSSTASSGVSSTSSVVTPPSVKPQPPTQPPIHQGKCYVGGCSGQVCSDDPNALSTCEYKASYACYKNAACERQSNGACGWTETPSLRKCLSEPEAITQ